MLYVQYLYKPMYSIVLNILYIIRTYIILKFFLRLRYKTSVASYLSSKSINERKISTVVLSTVYHFFSEYRNISLGLLLFH